MAGEGTAWRFELARYDQFLLAAAEMLEVPLPEPPPGAALSPEARAVLEDRLACAGLDVLETGRGRSDVLNDGDLAP